MAITILDDSMSSDRTTHRARLIPGRAHLWEVSWLSGRRLDRDGAITAMVLADLVGSGGLQADDRQWIFAEGWAEELGLRASEAVERRVAVSRALSEHDGSRSWLPCPSLREGLPVIEINDESITLTIDDEVLASARFSRHPAASGDGVWIAPYHAARLFTGDQAITAMVIAERRAAGCHGDNSFTSGWR
jgi:hypothetical protein